MVELMVNLIEQIILANKEGKSNKEAKKPKKEKLPSKK